MNDPIVAGLNTASNAWTTNVDGSMRWEPAFPRYEQPVVALGDESRGYVVPRRVVTLCLCYEPHMSAHIACEEVKQDEGRTVVRCTRCGTLRVLEPFDAAAYRRLYVDDDLYHVERMRAKGYDTYYDRVAHDERLAEGRLRKLRAHAPNGLLLDVGCSNGAFVRRANRAGWSALGLELNPHMADFARWSGGAPVLVGDIAAEGEALLLGLAQGAGRGFDAATFHDVLEHFLDPRRALRGAFKILRKGGILVVDTPDATSPSALEQQGRWHHIKPLEHPWLFSRALLTRLITDAGFAVVEVDEPLPGKGVWYSRRREEG